tara:strand:+ start:215 stop:1090 length:876 start_codon:yes stop_codon:yes gene_type:complete
MKSIEDYGDEVELVCIDDNSKEPGTKEYLDSLSARGWKVIDHETYRQKKQNRQKKDIQNVQNVIDEFSDALNIFLKESTGDIIAPLQGDMEFVIKGWLPDYVALFKNRKDAFAASFDAQRKIRLQSDSYDNHTKQGNNIFAVKNQKIISGAGNCFYRRECLQKMGGWKINQKNNAEDLFTITANQMFPRMRLYVPWVPVSIAIYTDPRGTCGRVRGNKRIGLYWEALSDNRYYQWVDQKTFKICKSRPVSIEEMAKPNGDWKLPLDADGSWKKNPINWPTETENIAIETIY